MPVTCPIVSTPSSRFPVSKAVLRRLPEARGAISSKGAPFFSSSETLTASPLFSTRVVFAKRRSTSVVLISSACMATASLPARSAGASSERKNRVPTVAPSQPSISAAASPRPSPTPPQAITGISNASAAAGQSTIEPISFSPTWPAASVPSMITASQPMACALSACLTIVHL